METETSGIKTEISTETFPQRIDFKSGISIADFISWYKTNQARLEEDLHTSGAILVRGIAIEDIQGFEQVTQSMSPKFLDYVDGNSPRTKLSGSVYTSTEYDPSHYITLHNELSYSNKWPGKLYFSCIIPAATGGETPIADGRKIIAQMDSGLLADIESRKVRYIRNLHGGQGFGPSWQDTFETENREAVEQICQEREIEFHWKEDGGIRVEHIRDGIITHPKTGEKVWFNQIDQFHASHLEEEIYETLMLMYDGDEEAMPMNVTFGDGTPITKEQVTSIKEAIDKVTVPVKWQKGDLLIIDNVMACHGRWPYTGERKVVVSMS
ncbi:MAG: TauD/TfdA family dioxygenase [Bacteroidota bacterium]